MSATGTANDILGRAAGHLQRGEARECFEILRLASPECRNESAWLFLVAVALTRMHSFRAARSYLQQHLALTPDSPGAVECLELIEKKLQAPISAGPLCLCDRKAHRTVAQLAADDQRFLLRKTIDRFTLTVFRHARVLRPYGLIAWEDGTIVAESAAGMTFTDESYSCMLYGTGSDKHEAVEQALSLTTGPADVDAEMWRRTQQPKIRGAEQAGFRGIYFAPLQFTHVRQALSTAAIPESRIRCAEEITLEPAELWMLEPL